ncbi:hypothetical protein H5410_061608 [Solanum commersonii]|uniref:Uncharacterized protein n=1 Tax=Solanum commersonii TaxID=4109 RepID=A0A9J5W8I1_SOLCO|nr:hypothetical protein H5410_061608 [Solanum commersonii]
MKKVDESIDEKGQKLFKIRDEFLLEDKQKFKLGCPQMHIMSLYLMKIHKFQVFELRDKAWTLSSKKEQTLKKKVKYARKWSSRRIAQHFCKASLDSPMIQNA